MNITSIKKRLDKLKTSLDSVDREIIGYKIIVDIDNEDNGGSYIKYKGQDHYIKVTDTNLLNKLNKQMINQKIDVCIVDDDNEVNLTDMLGD